MDQSPSFWLTPFNRIELAHAIQQYVFRGKISSIQAQKAWSDFQADCTQGIWTPINLPESIWDTSIQLAQMHGPTLGVRTLDSLHVACALELKAERFWTFDDRQARLAEAVGLDTNP
jgi:predicted nucleic acid-binding protein